MKLFELFSRNPQDAHTPEEEIDWLDDLKFYIDNNDELLTKHIFPAVARQKELVDDPKVYKLYIKPLRRCAEDYCQRFETEKPHKELFPTEEIVKLAKSFAEQQKQFIEKGDYQ